MRKSTIWVTVLILLTALVPVTFGQATDGNVVGTIVDSSGAAVPNVTVTATNIATGVKTTITNNASGDYRINNLPVGTYNINASASGFASTTLSNVAIELNKTLTANITMQVGTVTTTVEVTEAATVIDTTTAQVGTTVTERQVLELPASSLANGILNLSLLSAGVGSSGGIGYGTGPSVGGQRPTNNSFNVEGVDNNRKDVTGPVVSVSNEAVGEGTFLLNQFAPEFGHSSGGQFNAVIRSGGNDIHGSMYEYLENRNLNAVDQAFARQGILSNPRFDQNRLGATIGGPIIKNKLFYFGNFEYIPLGQSSTPPGNVKAPTADGYNILAGIPAVSQTNLGVLKQYLPAAGAADATTSVSGTTIPIGTIPLASANWQNTYNYVVGIDFTQSDRDQWRGRYVVNKIDTIDNIPNLPVFFLIQPTRAYLASLSEFHNFSPNFTNELRFSYNRFSQTVPSGNFKYPGLDQFPNILIENDLNVQIGPDPNGPQSTILNQYQIVDNVNWNRGSHSFKFGYDGRKSISPQSFVQRSRGDYDYTNIEPFLLDLAPDDLGERTIGLSPYSGNNIATYLYGNDNWRIRPNLTLNLGLRYEYTSVPFSERLQNLNHIADVPGLITFNKPEPQMKNFAPRVGIAYSPGKSGNTSIRAGFGIAYDQVFDNIGILSLPPQFNSTFDVSGTETNFLANGGIRPTLQPIASADDARAGTSGWIPPLQKVPYAISWNFGVQHVFQNKYTIEARYLGTRGVHLGTQNRINRQALVKADHQVPTFSSMPSASVLQGLTLTRGELVGERDAGLSNIYAPAGFPNNITAFLPNGNSIYHGLALQLNRRFTNGLQFVGAYTWSHNIDDSTDLVFATLLTPRRPQDFFDLRSDRASSALDRRHRLTFSPIWDVPWYKSSSNWFAKNIIGNWSALGTYTFESPEYADVQSGIDANLNGDAAGDRAVLNPAGKNGVGTDVIAVDRNGNQLALTSNRHSAPDAVAYIAIDPNARYIKAEYGTFPNAGRNTLPLHRINNVDLSVIKRFNVTESKRVDLGAQLFNAFNHPQFTPGSINTVTAVSQTSTRNFLEPQLADFNHSENFFSSNPRNVQFFLRLVF